MTNMQMTCLSWQPQRPSLLLKWPTATVLLDCAMDTAPLASFLPASLVHGTRLSSLPGFRLADGSMSTQLRNCCDQVFVDAVPEVHGPEFYSTPVESIDVVLVSNWMSIVALPFITERPEFRGVVYATDPTVQLGRLVMEELLEFVERVNKDRSDDKWREKDVWKSFSNQPPTDPKQWSSLYSTEQMNSCLAKVKLIAYRETVNIHGVLSVSAFSSGHSIGSANWTIQTDYEKVAYVSATSSRTSHTKAVDWEKLKGADVLVLTSVSRAPERNPEESVHMLCLTVVETLKRGGSVLIPIAPTGVLYDLLECLAANLDQSSVSVDTPIYFLSPVAESALAYANIYAEWLSEKKQNRVYVPEEPFPHSIMLKSGRLKSFTTMHSNFSREFRTPCVVFAGHPSMRFGDAVHFMELWGGDQKNAVLLTDPDYPMAEALAPFQPLAMRAYHFPIDTRLDFVQINTTIMRELAPKRLLLPEQLTKPPTAAPTRTDFVIQHPNQMSFRVGDTLAVPSLASRKRVRLDPDIAKGMDVSARGALAEAGICSLRGFLSAYDNILELKPDSVDKENDRLPAVRSRLAGRLFGPALIEALGKIGVRAEPIPSTDQAITLIRVPDWSAVVAILDDGKRSKITCESRANRRRLADVIATCLTPL